MKTVFITGTDTGTGKTVVTRLLTQFLSKKGKNAISQKWITTGSDRLPSRRYPFVFRFPASPHLAGALEKRYISKNKIKKQFKTLAAEYEFIVVEGVGGALVPFSKNELVIDIAKELNMPVIIVAGNKLGSINHTLLTIEAVKKRKMKLLGIIFNNMHKTHGKIIDDNPKIIKKISGEKILGILPRSKRKSELREAFTKIGNKIFNEYMD